MRFVWMTCCICLAVWWTKGLQWKMPALLIKMVTSPTCAWICLATPSISRQFPTSQWYLGAKRHLTRLQTQHPRGARGYLRKRDPSVLFDHLGGLLVVLVVDVQTNDDGAELAELKQLLASRSSLETIETMAFLSWRTCRASSLPSPDPAPVMAETSPATLLSWRGTNSRKQRRKYSNTILRNDQQLPEFKGGRTTDSERKTNSPDKK